MISIYLRGGTTDVYNNWLRYEYYTTGRNVGFNKKIQKLAPNGTNVFCEFAVVLNVWGFDKKVAVLKTVKEKIKQHKISLGPVPKFGG